MKETQLTPDLAKWSKKAQSSKGGTVIHTLSKEGRDNYDIIFRKTKKEKGK